MARSRRKRNHLLQLAIAHQRVSADDGKVERLQAVDHLEDPVYECLAFAPGGM